MVFDTKIMQDFLDENESHYVGKYRFHSGYRAEEYKFKNHYYMLDQNFRQIDIYVEIQCKDHLDVYKRQILRHIEVRLL